MNARQPHSRVPKVSRVEVVTDSGMTYSNENKTALQVRMPQEWILRWCRH